MKKCRENCVPYEETINVESLARAYVPMQKLCSTLPLQQGLLKGTIFPELYKPYK